MNIRKRATSKNRETIQFTQRLAYKSKHIDDDVTTTTQKCKLGSNIEMLLCCFLVINITYIGKARRNYWASDEIAVK